MNQDPIAALEIGTSRTTLLVGEPVAPGRVRVAAKATIPSSGVRKSQIVDIARAGVSVASVARQIADGGEYRVGQVVLAVSDPHTVMHRFVTTTAIEGPSVSENDMSVLYDQSTDAEKNRDNFALLDRSDLCWDVDGLKGVTNPLNVCGKQLSLHALTVKSDPNRLADARTACGSAGLGISDFFFAGTCAALAVLTPADRSAGTLLIDLGGGTTCWTVVCDDLIVHAGILGVGGEHFLNDIRHAFSTSRQQAEELLHRASATLGGESSGRIPLAQSITSRGEDTISRRALDLIVNARAAEILALIRDDLNAVGMLHRLCGGIVLTGGVSALKGIAPLAASVFGRSARLGTIVPEIEGLDAEPDQARFATAAGLLLRAQKDVPEESTFIGNVFGTLGKVFGK